MSIVVERLCGVYSDPSRQVFANASGWVMHTIMTVFVGRAEGAPAPDGVEVSEVRFFEVGQLPALPFGDEEWIRDALEARRTGKVALEYQGSQEPS
jgi:ADP-ribose pyrophosphatase YjhB (NUDIX family)